MATDSPLRSCRSQGAILWDAVTSSLDSVAEDDVSRACRSQGSITSGGPKSALYHLKIMLMVTSRAPWSISTSPAITLAPARPIGSEAGTTPSTPAFVDS